MQIVQSGAGQDLELENESSFLHAVLGLMCTTTERREATRRSWSVTLRSSPDPLCREESRCMPRIRLMTDSKTEVNSLTEQGN